MNEKEEKFAERIHNAWSHWMVYMFGECFDDEDGQMIIPAGLVKRWKRQMTTNYDRLSEKEKQSDRDIFKQYYSDLLDI